MVVAGSSQEGAIADEGVAAVLAGEKVGLVARQRVVPRAAVDLIIPSSPAIEDVVSFAAVDDVGFGGSQDFVVARRRLCLNRVHDKAGWGVHGSIDLNLVEAGTIEEIGDGETVGR